MTDEQLRAMARRVLALVVEERMVVGTIPLKSPVYGLKDSAMAMVNHIDDAAVAILREEMAKPVAKWVGHNPAMNTMTVAGELS